MQSSLLIKYLELNRLSLTLWRMDMTSLNFQWRDLPGHSKIHGFPELPLEKILQDKYTQLPWWTLNNSTKVCQLSRVGGKDLKDCTHKVLDRLFTNEVMALLNMKGKGKKDKMGIEDTNLFSAIKAAVMKWDQSATEAAIRAAAGDHLKHAPGRVGGGGYK